MDITDYLHKPSLIQSLDVSHIISKHFGALFSSDCVEPEIIENLTVSQGSTDEDHRNYVIQLIKVTNEREKLFESTQRLREHIYSARDQALMDDMKAEEENKDFAYLNLPPNESTFNKYIDNNLLRENGLIAPEDVISTLSLKDNTEKLDSTPGLDVADQRKNSAKEFTRLNLTKMSEYRLPPIERPKSNEKTKKVKESKKSKAPDMILAVEREEDKHMLDMMALKNNYLRNPRHILPGSKHQGKEWLVKVNSEDEVQRMFISIPEVLEFSDYEVGKVYEKVINFRNITSVLRTIRVLPPKSRYFSLSLGQFPGDKGLVAAGMSCQYAVRFSPDSLGDFEDEITAETQGGNTFIVKIISKRPRPLLSGSKVWDMGYSLVYGLKVVHYTIKNNGGLGKFCLVDSNVWPVSNPKSFITNKQIILEPFIIRPSYFELRPDESITLELLFCPISLGAVERNFHILCDNCHMETVKIKGQGEIANIIMESLEDGVSLADIGESVDISAQILVKFGALNPFTYCQKIIVLKNTSHIEIPFCWKIIKPNLKILSAETEETSSEVVQNRTLDFDSAFLIEPPFGIFQSNDSIAFTITFAPLEVKENHSVLHLVLQGIPNIANEQLPSEFQKECYQKQKPLMPIVEDFYKESQINLQTNNSQIRTICLNDITSLEIEVKGNCIPLEVFFNPPAIIISGELLINTSVRRQLQVSNKSMCPVNVNWTNSDSDSYIFTVEPQHGMIEPGEIGVVDICVVSSLPGFVRDTLICKVDNMDNPLKLVVEAKFKGPEIEIDQNNLDFGLMKVNENVCRVLKVINKSSINCAWRARIGGSDDIELTDILHIGQHSGILAPLQSDHITVTIQSSKAKNINCGLEISLEYGSTKYLNIMACIQSPQVVFGNSSIDVSGKLFVNVPSTFEVKLCNQSHLSTRFNWLTPIGPQSDALTVFIEPYQGSIQANGEVISKVSITSSIQDFIDNFILPCEIDDVEEPILLHVSGIVSGPQLSCKVLEIPEDIHINQEHDELMLNFGNDVELFNDVKKYVLIENMTSIVTTFCLSVNYFQTSSEEVESTKDRNKIRPNLADRQSKPDKLAHYDFCKKMLSNKLGLAVGFNPIRGTLQAYEKLTIEVTVYNDMWGTYNDFIRISGNAQMLEVESITIPMSISVKGVPIEFTMTSGRKEQKPILRLGSKPLGHEIISRKVRLNNKSPCDMYIDWEMYSQDSENEDKIIDLIINCGDPFPIPNSNNDSQYLDSTRFNDSIESNSIRQVTNREFDQVEEYDNKANDNLISVIIRPNEGTLTTKPITFDPPQLLIPSESFGFVTITFNPRNLEEDIDNNWDNNNGISYYNYLLGFVSLRSKDLQHDTFMSRKHQYAVDQIKLDITAKILKPSLQIEFADDDEEVRFKVPFSSLLNTKNMYSLTKSKAFTNYVIVRNLKDTEIAFSLKTRPPFEILNSKLREKAVLGIGEVMKIEIKFTLEKSQLSVLKDNSLCGDDDSKCLSIQKQLLLDSSERSLKNVIFRDVISINYDFTTMDQLIPMRAIICFPEFVLSKSTINFNTCFIGETCTEYFRIMNKSESSSVVLLKLDCNVDHVFEINNDECFIPFKELDTNDNQYTVMINFSPKQAIEYVATIVVSGMMGEEDFVLPISGRGSYDNQYQKKY